MMFLMLYEIKRTLKLIEYQQQSLPARQRVQGLCLAGNLAMKFQRLHRGRQHLYLQKETGNSVLIHSVFFSSLVKQSDGFRRTDLVYILMVI